MNLEHGIDSSVCVVPLLSVHASATTLTDHWTWLYQLTFAPLELDLLDTETGLNTKTV